MEEAIKVEFQGRFRICPECGYRDGFHSFFERETNEEKISWKFICPSCHKAFDIGLKVSLDD